MARKIIKKAVKEGIKRGRGRPKGSTNKIKTTKRSEAPIKSERSKIAEANAKAKAKRAKATGITAGPGASAVKKTLPVGTKRAVGTAGAAILGATQLNKKKPTAKKETFAQAFKKARAKGEGTKFTHNGKSYTAVTKTDLKKKGYDANELAAYNKRGGKARGPLNRLGQKAKKVLLGKDKKFGGDKGAIDFIRKPKKKASGGMMKTKGYKSGGMMKSKGYRNGGAVNKRKATGAATRGFGKAYMKGKR
tara:strand:- start:2109 stop:2852 length:744 start_codon:yes stop_codon:yes gene_type:complete